MRLTPPEEIESRTRALQARMAGAGLDAVLVLQNADLFYLAGTVQQGALYVPASGDPLYLVRKDLGRARAESPLTAIAPLRSPRDLPPAVAAAGLPPPSRIGMELDVVPVALFRRWEAVFPGVAIKDASPLLRDLRSVKSAYELGILHESAARMDRVFRRALEVIRPGVTDLELVAELEHAARLDGHQGIVHLRGFNSEIHFGHVFSGPASAIPGWADTPLGGPGLNPRVGQGAAGTRIEPGRPVVVDMAFAYDGYIVDQTRTVAVGELPRELVRAYETTLRVQECLVSAARPGATWGGVYDECLAVAVEAGVGDRFMGAPGSQVPFIAHGVGLELDEWPLIARGFQDRVLREGMVLAAEPKVVFPGLGAVGIENTFVVGPGGLERITCSREDLVVIG